MCRSTKLENVTDVDSTLEEFISSSTISACMIFLLVYLNKKEISVVLKNLLPRDHRSRKHHKFVCVSARHSTRLHGVFINTTLGFHQCSPARACRTHQNKKIFSWNRWIFKVQLDVGNTNEWEELTRLKVVVEDVEDNKVE